MVILTSGSLMVNGCDWGLIKPSIDQLTESPPIIEPMEPIVDLKVEVAAPPTAKPFVGRMGIVYNPYTGGVVDVRGLASGLLVRDPEDPDKAHTFYVP